MEKSRKYILNELKAIQKECREKNISANVWVERYADSYREKHWNKGRKR